MGTHTTTAGKLKVSLALDPGAYQLLQEMAPGPRAVGSLLADLIRDEAARREDASVEHSAPTAAERVSVSLVAVREEAQRLYQSAARELAERERAQKQLLDAAGQLQRQGERLRVLHEIDRAILSARSPKDIAEAAADGVLRVTGALRVYVALWQAEGEMLEVLAVAGLAHPLVKPGDRMQVRPWPWLALARAGRVAFDEDLSQQADPSPESQAALAQGIRSHAVIPLVAAGQAIGYLAIARSVTGRLPVEELVPAQQIADSLAVALHNTRLNAEVQERRRQFQMLSRQLVKLQEEERRALSRDLHDTSGQSITALKLGLGALKRAEGCSDGVRTRVNELLEMADTVSEDLHRLAVNLRPSSLDRYGLIPALEQLLTEFRKQTGLGVEFLAEGMEGDRLPSDMETALYRIVQEATTNCARYAQAGNVAVMVQNDGDQIRVIVEDDGRGFDVDEGLRSGRLGLLGMRERAEMLGGTLEIESSPGHGTSVFATLPVGPTEIENGTPEPAENLSPAVVVAAEGSAAAAEARLAGAAELARAKALGDALIDITAAIARCSDADEILRLVLARSAEAIGRDNAHIALPREGRWDIRRAYREGLDLRRAADLDTPAFEWVATRRQVLVVDDTSARELDDALRLEARHVKSYACIPLLAGDRLLGVLSFIDYSTAAAFHPSEVEFLNRLATLVALALENAQLHEIEIRQRDELAQRVEELQTLLDVVPVGIAIAQDPECMRIEVNPANARLLGMPPHSNASLSIPEHEREATFKVYQDGRELRSDEMPMQMAARGHDVRDSFVDVVRSDGQTVTLLAYAVPLFDAHGRPRGAIGAFVDATEQRRAQAEAEAARQTLEALMNYIPEGITIADAPDVRLRYVSRHGQELLGAPHEDMTAGEVAAEWTVYEPDGVTLMPEDDLPLVRAIRYGETVRDRELIQVGNQGRQIPLLCNAGPIRDAEGRITGGIVAWRDITALKEAREALQQAHAAVLQSEERYRSLFNGMTEGCALHELVCGEDGKPVDYRFLAINSAFECLTGLKREDVEGRLKSEVLPGDDPHWLETYSQVALTGVPLRFENHSAALGRWYDVYAYCPAPQQFAVIFTDITERLRAGEELRDERERYRRLAAELDAALSSIADGLVIYDREGRIVRMNATAEEMLGYSVETQAATIEERSASVVEAHEPNGSPFSPYEYPAVQALRGKVVRNQEMVLHVPARPDRQLLVAVSSAPIRGDDGAVTGCVTTFRDTAAYHEANKRLSQTAARLQQANAELEAILAAIPDGLIVYDAAGNVTRMNDLALDMLGYPEDVWKLPVRERVGSTVQAFYPNGSPCPRNEYSAMRALRGEVVRNEDLYIHLAEHPEKDFWGMFSAGPMWGAEGQLAGAVIIMRNTGRLHEITEQLALRQAELEQAYVQVRAQADALQEAAESLEQRVLERTADLDAANARLQYQAMALGNVNDAVIGTDADLHITTWNRAAEELYGWEAKEVMGQILTDVTRAEMSAEKRAAALRVLAETGRWRGTAIHLRRDGTPIWVEGSVTALRDSAGKVSAMATVNRDVTERKRTEEGLQALSRRLVELQERERSYVADQLYNEAGQVLAALKLQMSLLGRETYDESVTGGRLAEVQTTLDHVMRAVHELAVQLHPATLDHLGLVAALNQHLVQFGQEHGLRVEFEAVGLEGVRIPAEVETAVYRMVQEALMNVAQHAHANWVGLLISHDGNSLTVSVEDDGVGFDLEAASRGGGLGLIGMRERAAGVGAHLVIETHIGTGTTIIIEVPVR